MWVLPEISKFLWIFSHSDVFTNCDYASARALDRNLRIIREFSTRLGQERLCMLPKCGVTGEIFLKHIIAERISMNGTDDTAVPQEVSLPPQYFVLVDFDNLAKNVFVRGNRMIYSANVLYDLVRRLDQGSPFFEKAMAGCRVKMRLYGGWYQHNHLSHNAQDVQRARMIGILGVHSHGKIRLSVQSEFAHHLHVLEDGSQFLYSTFRSRHYSRCPLCNSSVSGYEKRQKMVDTMMCCDLLHLSSQENTTVAIVSSDDDLIPPLLQQAHGGHHVYHMLTTSAPSASFSQYFQPFLPDHYHWIPY